MINDPTLPETDAPLEMLAETGDAGGMEPPTPPDDGVGRVSRPGDNYDGPKIEISEEMRNSYLGYAMSTIVSRALPDVRDGLKPVQRRILYAMRDLNLTPANRHLKSAKIVGECFVAGTKVSTPDGLRNIEDLTVGDSVYTQGGVRRVTEAYIQPEQPLLSVELSEGRFVTCTQGQQFKAVTPELTLEWRDASALKPGDFIVSRGVTGASGTAWTPDVAYFVGFFLADGWIDRCKRGYNRFSIAATDLPIMERLRGIAERIFGVTSNVIVRGNMFYLRFNSTNSRLILQMLARQGVDLSDKRTENICVPAPLWTASPETVMAFVSGFLDGDGSVHANRCHFVLTNTVAPFLRDVQTLLHAHGVHSRLFVADKNRGKAEWFLEVSSHSLHKIGPMLTLSCPHKAERLARCLANLNANVENWQRIPYLGAKLLSEFQEKHLGGGWYKTPDGGKVRCGLRYEAGTKFRYAQGVQETFEIAFPQLERLGFLAKMEAIGSAYLPTVKAWLEQDVTFAQVRRVTPTLPAVTYDIQVEGDHEFIANGMLVHNCIGNYHPHGDQAIYMTMVRMAQPFSLRYPLVDGQGNFGSVDDDPPAAYRYTEARMTALAVEMLEDIEKNTVDFYPTFDNERMQPTVLPGKFPHMICNGGSGIAVAMANNMPPHNLTEVCEATMHLLEHPNATIEQLMQFIPGPDFPTSGLILGSKGIRSAYETGRGSVTMQAKTSIEPMDGGKNAIIVTELPYQVIKKKLIEDIADLVKEKKVDGITAINDFSDRNGMRMVIELRRDVIPQKVLNYLLKHTALRLNFGVIMLALVDGGRGPRTLSLKGILQEYLDHRRVVITRRTKYELNRAKARAHILEGLQIAVQFLDEVIQIIRASSSTEQARTRLIDRFAFSGLQVEAILNMQLRQLTALEQDKIEGEYRELLKEVGRLDDILSDPRRVDALVKADLKYLKDKYGDERRTRIIPTEAEEINIEDLIANEEMLLTVTRDGYIKRMAMDSFPSQHRGGKGRIAGKTKEEDNIEHIFRASTHDYVLFFTDRGRVYRLKAYDVPQTSRTAMGTAIVNLIQIQSDERITATIPIRDLRTAEGYLVMVTARGEIKRTKITEYANLRANGLITFDLEPNDRLGWVKHTDGKTKMILTSVKGMAIQFHEEDVPSRGRAAGGVRGMTLDGPTDRIVTADLVPEKSELLVVSKNGYGKRTPMSEYRLQSRGGKGIKTMDITEKTGSLIQACVLESSKIGDLRLVIVTEQGIGIRMKVAEVRQTSTRSTQGVKLIELAGNDWVKSAEYLDATKKAEEEAAE